MEQVKEMLSPTMRKRKYLISSTSFQFIFYCQNGKSTLRAFNFTILFFAGTITEFAGTSFTIVAFAPIIAPSPIVIGPKTIAPVQIVTLLPMVGYPLPESPTVTF